MSLFGSPIRLQKKAFDCEIASSLAKKNKELELEISNMKIKWRKNIWTVRC